MGAREGLQVTNEVVCGILALYLVSEVAMMGLCGHRAAGQAQLAWPRWALVEICQQSGEPPLVLCEHFLHGRAEPVHCRTCTL